MPWFGRGRSEVPSTWAAALEQVLEAVDPTRKVAEFVLAGQPVEALENVNSGHRMMQRHGRWNSEPAKQAAATLYAGFGDVDAAVLRRWSRVLDATGGTGGWGLALGDVAGCHWPELMLQQAAACVPSGQLPITFADLERIAAEDGTAPTDLVWMAFTLAPHHRYQSRSVRDCLSRLPGFEDAVAAHREIAASVLVSGSVDERVAAASLLAALGDTVLGVLAEPLAEAATSTSAQVRAAIRPLITRIDGPAIDPLRRLAADGEPARRACPLEVLAARPDQRAWALKTAAADQAASVRALSARWEAGNAPAEAGEEIEILPESPPLPSWSLAAADAERVANQVCEALRRGVESFNGRLHGQFKRPLHEPSPDTPDRIARLLVADGPARVDDKLDGIPAPGPVKSQVAGVIQHHGYSPATAIQLMAVLGWLGNQIYRPWADVIEEAHARTGQPDLLTVQRMLDAVGVDGRASVWSAYGASWGPRIGRGWPDEHVWPCCGTRSPAPRFAVWSGSRDPTTTD